MSKLCLKISGNLILSSNQVKLLGVNIDNSLKFEAHARELCRKVKKKHDTGMAKIVRATSAHRKFLFIGFIGSLSFS